MMMIACVGWYSKTLKNDDVLLFEHIEGVKVG